MRYWLSATIFVLLIVDIFLVQKVLSYMKSNASLKYGYEQDAVNLYDEKENYLKLFSRQLELQNFQLREGITVVTDENRQISFKSLLNTSPKLIILIPDKTCNACFDYLFAELKKFSKEVNKARIITIVPKSKLREINSLYKNYEMDIVTYGADMYSFFPEFSKGFTPLLFTTDSKLLCSNVFIPDQLLSTLIARYFEVIKGKL